MIANNSTASSQLVLIVDDDKSIRMTARLILEAKGYRVMEAENGQQCLDIYRLPSLQVPSLILMDAVMPGMDGFTCYSELKKLLGYNCPPTLMLTVLDDRDSIYQSIDLGINDYLLKPINWQDLLQKVQHLLFIQRASKSLKKQLGELESLNFSQKSNGKSRFILNN